MSESDAEREARLFKMEREAWWRFEDDGDRDALLAEASRLGRERLRVTLDGLKDYDAEAGLCRYCSEPILLANLDEIAYREPDYDGPGKRIWRHSNGYGACPVRFAEPRPPIVCLCGSTRFMDAYREANLRLTLTGSIVLSIGCDTKSDDALLLTERDKVRLDELHKRKIDLADSILVLNVGGYIGSSTRSEIDYALAHGKDVTYLEEVTS